MNSSNTARGSTPERRLKILHLASEYPPAKVYGLGRFVHGLARAQAAAGDEVHVLTNSHGGEQDDVVVDGVHLHRIDFPNPPRPSDGHGEVLQWNHGAVSRLLDRRDVLRDVDVVCGHDWLTAIAAREAALLLERPLVVTFHDEVTGKHAGVLDREGRFVRDLEALTAHDASHVIANSDYIARQVLRHYGLAAERVTAVPGGIDPTLLDVSTPERVRDFRAPLAGEDEVLVAFVGRLDPEKGLGLLAEAIDDVASRPNRVRFVIAGSGKREEALRARLADRARLLGYVKGEALSYLYRAADVVVVPSVYEPFGLVALEAMLAGAAVVVSSAGGLPEIVRHERDGLVFDAGDPAALAAAIERLAQDPTLRQTLATSAAARAKDEFAWSKIAARTRQVYEHVLGQPPSLVTMPPTLPAPASDHVLVMDPEVEVPPGSEDWLAGATWLLDDSGAACVVPTFVDRGALDAPPGLDDEPRRLVPPPDTSPCVLVRRTELAGPTPSCSSLIGELVRRTGRACWRHPARLVSGKGEVLPASIVVVAYQAAAFTRECLESVLAHTRPPYELILVDNGSTDGTAALFEDVRRRARGRVRVQVLRNDQNLGYPVAATQGAHAARGRHVVLLNNDTRVRPGWLEALLDAATRQARVGLVTAKVLNLDGSVQSAGGILHKTDGTFEIPHQGEDRLAPQVTSGRAVDNAGGPCLLVTRELLDALGDEPLFDPAFTPGYFEDSDLCLRARERGFTLLYEPGAEVFHHGKVTSSQVEGVWTKFEQNKQRFHARWHARLAEDEDRRESEVTPDRRLKIVLCYHQDPTTTAAYCERALRASHDVVTAGRGQDLDLGDGATASQLVEATGGADLLLVIEGATFVPQDLERCPCPTALWAIDNHLHATPAVGAGGHFALARPFDHVFVAQRDYAAAFASHGISATWVPLACDPGLHALAPHDAGRDIDVLFVGHVRPFHQRRRRLLDRLAARFRLEEHQGVFGQDMARLLARARIVFNCSLAGDLNMRVFEGLASGALLVTDRIDNGLETFFADGEHLALYDDADLEQVIERYLGDERARLLAAARGQRLTVQHHTYAARMRQLANTVTTAPRPGRLARLMTPTTTEATS